MVAVLFLRAARDGDFKIKKKKGIQIGNQVYFPTQFELCQSELNSMEGIFQRQTVQHCPSVIKLAISGK